MVDTNTIVSVLAMVGVALMGVYLERVRRARDKAETKLDKQFQEVETAMTNLDIRVQLAENRAVVLETKADTHGTSLTKLSEDLADIRDNMVRREDMVQWVDQIRAVAATARIVTGRPRRRKT